MKYEYENVGVQPITLRGSKREALRLENLGKAVEIWFKQYRFGDKKLCDEVWDDAFDRSQDRNLQFSFSSYRLKNKVLKRLASRTGIFWKNGRRFREAYKKGDYAGMAISFLKEFQICAEIEQADIEEKNRLRKAFGHFPIQTVFKAFPLREATRKDGPDRNKLTFDERDGKGLGEG